MEAVKPALGVERRCWISGAFRGQTDHLEDRDEEERAEGVNRVSGRRLWWEEKEQLWPHWVYGAWRAPGRGV